MRNILIFIAPYVLAVFLVPEKTLDRWMPAWNNILDKYS